MLLRVRNQQPLFQHWRTTPSFGSIDAFSAEFGVFDEQYRRAQSLINPLLVHIFIISIELS